MIYPDRLEFNALLLIHELEQRGVELEHVGTSSLVKAQFGNHIEYIDQTNLNNVPYVTKVILDNKYLTKQVLMNNGIQVNEGQEFIPEDYVSALHYAHQLGYPVVVKPTMGSNGVKVTMNINNAQEFTDCFIDVAQHVKDSYFAKVLVERQYTGEEYRVFATRTGYYAVVHREPANVIGDGISTIHQLIENENYRRMNPRISCLCTIKVDSISNKFMSDRGISYEDKPLLGEKIYIRPNSNVSGGANCRDVTEKVYKGVFRVADQILSCFKGLDYIGIDYMTPDITSENADKDYKICELNSCPGISLHTHEETGSKKDVPKVMIDFLFPETKKKTAS